MGAPSELQCVLLAGSPAKAWQKVQSCRGFVGGLDSDERPSSFFSRRRRKQGALSRDSVKPCAMSVLFYRLEALSAHPQLLPSLLLVLCAMEKNSCCI